jgi:hypothetical protein
MTPGREIDDVIRQSFDTIFEELSMEAGHSLAADIKEEALRQVFGYYRKLRAVAESVTETEVRLSLTGQKTPAGRTYALEGIVDIVNENDMIIMYDIKTHSAGEVRTNRERYRDQLNVYAHIFQNVQRKKLDGTAIIATRLPRELSQALKDREEERIERELLRWEPVVEIGFDEKNVRETIEDFGRAVDRIEESNWQPKDVQELSEEWEGRSAFGTAVCRNCDARFSCPSYRRWASASARPQDFDFLSYVSDPGAEEDVESRRDSLPETGSIAGWDVLVE